MCDPISGNFVRPRKDLKVRSLPGSKGIEPHRDVKVNPGMCGMVDERPAGTPKSSIVLFEIPDAGVLCVEIPHALLKGVEL